VDGEKRRLEQGALDLYLEIYNAAQPDGYTLVQWGERPDALLRDRAGRLLGIEITHVYHAITEASPESEAQLLLGRSASNRSGLQSFDVLLRELHARLDEKRRNVASYACAFPVALLVRVASPIFLASDFRAALADVPLTLGRLFAIWLLVRADEGGWALLSLS
jgi:hypothetical protein